jgi:tetratricopeptide (TPR) repeat protein
MNKTKSIVLLLTGLFFANVVLAQTIDEGRKFLLYERYKSAKAVFEKLIAANANDADAIYWLGQTLITSEDYQDIPAAKALYQKAAMANSSSAILLAGLGHIELLEGKTQDARNRFETAIGLSQGKNAAVLNAIGFANIDAKDGDAQYAVDKLTLATGLKKMIDPAVHLNLGHAYKKLGDGGSAQKAYEAALTLNPNYAAASYRIGKIYQTQGPNQEEIYMKYFNDAIQKDPTFGPVYENLYVLFYKTNVTKSSEYLDKYIANTDEDPKNCYYLASMKFARGLFAETITKSDECIGAGGTPYPNLYGLKAYAAVKLNDSINAKSNFELYFQKQLPQKIGSGDYETYASVLLKFPGNEVAAAGFIEKAVTADSTEKGKVALLKKMAAYFETQKKSVDAAIWYNKILSVKKEPKNTDYFNAGYNYYRAGDYQTAVGILDTYTQKYPDDIYSHYWKAKSSWAIDTSLALGLANPSFEKTIELGLRDSVKFKSQLLASYKYFIVYNALYKKDKVVALDFCNKVLAIDSTDAETLSNKDILSGIKAAPTRATTPAPAATPKPKTPGAVKNEPKKK